MRKIILSIFVIITMSFANAHAARLVWVASTGVVTGYTVYYHDLDYPGTEYHRNLSATPTECELSTLNLYPGKTYQFSLTAYNAAGESGRSNTVDYLVPAYAPPSDYLPPSVINISGPVTINISP